MPDGPGKYDDLATIVRELANAHGVVVVVIGGDRGNGFSVQLKKDATPGAILRTTIEGFLPEVLRNVADEIERSGAKPKSRGGQS